MSGILKKIFLVDLFQGLWVTFRNQHPKYIYTEQYPAERPKVAERYRGAPRLNVILRKTCRVKRDECNAAFAAETMTDRSFF